MNDFFNSKFVKDLQNGQLPELQVEATISTSSLLKIGALILIVGTVLIAGNKLIK